MTLSEFYEFLLLGGAVECRLPQQRNTLARFIQDEFGFQIGPGSLDYITRYPEGVAYTFVELYKLNNGETVTSLCVNALGKTIPFDRVSHLISFVSMKLDDRTDEEFLEAFTELMS